MPAPAAHSVTRLGVSALSGGPPRRVAVTGGTARSAEPGCPFGGVPVPFANTAWFTRWGKYCGPR
ncbi:hypothetical protein CLV40_11830 [Actinokineospora auranticolor]|uniref:Uncharacterized protein n=1 Tax=Actinokineospora auranticolor TaxID=155976 RepID=A0A2S6GHG4_9PSEU|nr:hypothetical protein CLV40_11830 [Actinokineospora auranticolor]